MKDSYSLLFVLELLLASIPN
eukprot:COSAG02_NODE_51157_length_316_cov_0.580645_1_plen_20_part_10